MKLWLRRLALRRPAACRAGVSLVECIVALTVGSLLSACIATIIATQCRLLQAMTRQSADAEAMRVVHGVLQADLRATSRADIRRAAGDSIAARLFRSVGLPCGRVGGDLLVRFSGLRSPAAGKDSLVFVYPAGDQAAPLVEAEPGACEAGAHEQVLRLSGAGEPAVVLLFESGTYYVRDRAFRYRLGAEGRQPITDERFAAAARSIAMDDAAGVLTVQVKWPHRQFVDTVLIQLANAP